MCISKAIKEIIYEVNILLGQLFQELSKLHKYIFAVCCFMFHLQRLFVFYCMEFNMNHEQEKQFI